MSYVPLTTILTILLLLRIMDFLTIRIILIKRRKIRLLDEIKKTHQFLFSYKGFM